MNTEQMIEKLRNTLEKKRFEHSINVMNSAVELAKRYGADVEKTQIAGLLHDCAKNIPGDVAIEYCKERGLSLKEVCIPKTESDHPPDRGKGSGRRRRNCSPCGGNHHTQHC